MNKLLQKHEIEYADSRATSLGSDVNLNRARLGLRLRRQLPEEWLVEPDATADVLGEGIYVLWNQWPND